MVISKIVEKGFYISVTDFIKSKSLNDIVNNLVVNAEENCEASKKPPEKATKNIYTTFSTYFV